MRLNVYNVNLGYVKLFASKELNRLFLKDHINQLINELEIDFDITIEIIN
jgi:hypothetical protein